jgi:hypothetical protein
MKLTENKLFIAAMLNCKLTAFKTGFGHDKRGAMGKVYISGKLSFAMHDDGNYGEIDVDYSTNGKEIFENFLKENNVAHHIIADSKLDESNHYKKPEDIGEHDYINTIFDYLANLLSLEKALAQITRAKDKKIMIGTVDRYRPFDWKKFKLSELAKMNGGLAALQKTYDKLKSQLKEGEEIFNLDHLASLGIKI